MSSAKILACLSMVVAWLAPLCGFTHARQAKAASDGIRVRGTLLQSLCTKHTLGQRPGDETQADLLASSNADELAASLAYMDIDLILDDYFDALPPSLAELDACQSVLLDRVLPHKAAFLTTVNTLVQKPGHHEKLLHRLLNEGHEHLDAASFFRLIDLACKARNFLLGRHLRDMVVIASQRHPEELVPAIWQAILHQDANLVVALWEAAPRQARSLELITTILELGTQAGYAEVVLRFARSFQRYEDLELLGIPAKRFATSLLVAPKISAKLWLSYLAARAAAGEEAPSEAAAAQWQHQLTTALAAFIRDDKNPFYRRAQLQNLEAYLLPRINSESSAASLQEAAQAWRTKIKAYGIPLAMRTSNWY